MAAVLVRLLNSPAPDLVVATIIALVVLNRAVRTLLAATNIIDERRECFEPSAVRVILIRWTRSGSHSNQDDAGREHIGGELESCCHNRYGSSHISDYGGFVVGVVVVITGVRVLRDASLELVDTMPSADLA